MKPLLGLAIVAAHAIGFAVLAQRCAGTELGVEIHAARAAPALAIDGTVPTALAARVAIDTDDGTPPGPGLHRKRWSVSYRGGFQRAVGAAQLVGPFQDPAAPACSGRVIVGQRMLDDGHAGDGTIAHVMAQLLDAELQGESMFPIGDYKRVDHVALRWARLEQHPDDRATVGDAPHGYVRVAATIVFDHVDIPILVALVPEVLGDHLHFRIAAHAELQLGNAALQWLSDKLGGNRLATRLASRQIDDSLITTLAPPPPFPLPGGQEIHFIYCNEPPDIADNAYAALPFAVAIGRVAGDPTVLPPRLGPGPHQVPSSTTTAALDLDLDALNALLYELWRGGLLDRQLADAGLDRMFNSDPTVTEFLSVRISPIKLALPPVIVAAHDALRMSAEARVAIGDGTEVTTGRVWGGLDFHFVTASQARVDLGALELSCERTPTLLVPCFSDLVGALRDRGAEVHGALTSAFAKLLSDIFVGRLGASGLPTDVVIKAAIPSVTFASPNATLHLELDAQLAPAR